MIKNSIKLHIMVTNSIAIIIFFFSNFEKSAGVIKLENPKTPANMLAYKLA